MKSFFFLLFIIGVALLGYLVYNKVEIEESATTLLRDAQQSYESIVEESTTVIEEAKAAKAKVEETIDDVQNAFEKIEEAKNAISEIAE